MSHLHRAHLHRVFSFRRLVGIVALLGVSPAAFAQSTQALVLAFDGAAPVPIGPWTSVLIALTIAACALVFLRRRGASRFAQWCLLVATGGVLAVIPPVPDADALTGPILLVTSPLTLSPISCPGAVNVLTFQNATGNTTTIRGVTLTGVGGCSLSGAPGAPASAPLPNGNPACTVGLIIPNTGQCTVTLFNIT